MKSNQFHGSLRNVNCPTQKPLATIFISASKVYIPVNAYLLKPKVIGAEQTQIFDVCLVDAPKSKLNKRSRVNLLHILGPVWGLCIGHESAIGQDGEHYNHAK